MEIKAVKKERPVWVKPVAGILAVLIIYREAVMGQWVYVGIAVLVLLACFFDKDLVISEKGVDIRRSLFGKVSHELWAWDQVTAIKVDRKKEKPNIGVHIAKETVIRVYILTPRNTRDVLELAQEMNPDIVIKDDDE